MKEGKNSINDVAIDIIAIIYIYCDDSTDEATK
jgi:hypothetical protein